MALDLDAVLRRVKAGAGQSGTTETPGVTRQMATNFSFFPDYRVVLGRSASGSIKETLVVEVAGRIAWAETRRLERGRWRIVSGDKRRHPSKAKAMAAARELVKQKKEAGWVQLRGGSMDRGLRALDLDAILKRVKKQASAQQKSRPRRTQRGGAMAHYEAKLEYVGGTSAKFWNVIVQGRTVIASWGRIGRKAQTGTWGPYPSVQAAVAVAEDKVQKKLEKGYYQV